MKYTGLATGAASLDTCLLNVGKPILSLMRRYLAMTWILPALRNNNEFERSLGSNIGPFPKVPKDRKGGIQIYESE